MEVRPNIQLSNGVYISVQASAGHHCLPRQNHGPWTHVEIGNPSIPPPDS